MYIYVLSNLKRRISKNIIFITILSIVFWGILFGIALYSAAENGEAEAYKYQGAALSVGASSVQFTEEECKRIESIQGVTGVDKYRYYTATSKEVQVVREYTGVSPTAEYNGVIRPSDISTEIEMSLISNRKTSLDYRFYRGKAIALSQGNFPKSNTNQVIIESRFAALNKLQIGDIFSLDVQDMMAESEKIPCEFIVSGIYKIDAEFVITDQNYLGEGVFSVSPYNVIYGDYDYILKHAGDEEAVNGYCSVFVDKFENIDTVAEQISAMYHDEVTISRSMDRYLEGEASAVVTMKNYAFLILVYVAIFGILTLLIVVTFFTKQYIYECGMFMAIGFSKIKVLVQHLIVTSIIVLCSFLISMILYKGTADTFLVSTYDTIKQIIEENKDGVTVSPYETPGLDEPFSWDVTKVNLMNMEYIGYMIGCVFALIIVMLVIPVCIIVRLKPQRILKSS